MHSIAATSPLAGVLLPLRDVRVELFPLVRGENGPDRRNMTFPRLLHLRPQRLHLRSRRRGVTPLPRRAGASHRFAHLLIGRIGPPALPQLLETSLLIRGEVDALHEALARPALPTTPGVFDSLRRLRRLRRGGANRTKGKSQAERHGH
jgi:hypothetical protein